MAVVTYTIRDRSDEYSSVAINFESEDTDTIADLETTALAMRALIAPLVTGNIAKQTITASQVVVEDVRPANPYAQRELGLRLFYQDEVNSKKYHITLPCPDLLVVASGGTDEVDLSGIAVVNAFVQALEQFMRSPEGNEVQVYKGVIVGRRN